MQETQDKRRPTVGKLEMTHNPSIYSVEPTQVEMASFVDPLENQPCSGIVMTSAIQKFSQAVTNNKFGFGISSLKNTKEEAYQ